MFRVAKASISWWKMPPTDSGSLHNQNHGFVCLLKGGGEGKSSSLILPGVVVLYGDLEIIFACVWVCAKFQATFVLSNQQCSSHHSLSSSYIILMSQHILYMKMSQLHITSALIWKQKREALKPFFCVFLCSKLSQLLWDKDKGMGFVYSKSLCQLLKRSLVALVCSQVVWS